MQDNITYKAGSYLFIEGDEDTTHLYIIKSGKISLRSSNSCLQHDHLYAVQGETVGFISSLNQKPRMETALVEQDTVLLKLTVEELLSLLQKNSSITMKILHTLSEQLRRYSKIAISNKDALDFPPEESLYDIIKYYNEKEDWKNTLHISKQYLQHFSESSKISSIKHLVKRIEAKGVTDQEVEFDGIYRRFNDGDMIFSEHELGEELYIIQTGKVKILKYNKNALVMLSLLREGDIFGELAIISDKPRNATAISYGKTTLMSINRDSLLHLLNKSPEMLKKIFTSISKRVWFTLIQVEAMMHKRPLTKLYAFLENKLLENNISLRSNETVSFKFGIDDLLDMAGLKQNEIMDDLDELLNDTNINFNFGQIRIESPKELSAIAKYLKSRDHLCKDNVLSRILVSKEGESVVADTFDLDTTQSKRTYLEGSDAPGGGSPTVSPQNPKAPTSSIHKAPQNDVDERIKEEVRMLIRKLEQGGSRIVINCASRLEKLKVTAKDAVPALERFLTDNNKHVRRAVVKAMSNIMPKEETFELFSGKLEDNNEFVRMSVALGIGEIQPCNQKQSTQILMSLLKDKNLDVRSNAIRSLGWVGPGAMVAVPELLKYLKAENETIRVFTVIALGEIAFKEKYANTVKNELMAIQKNDKSRRVRTEAKKSLKKFSK